MIDEEGKAEDLGRVMVPCDKFGGTRPAACCVRFDKYKSCRRRCFELKKILIQNPDFAKKVEEHFASRVKRCDVVGASLFESKSSQSGKNLPDPVLGCKYCNFIGKSVRGLKVHMRRTHNK